MISTRWRYVTMQSAPAQTRNGHRNAGLAWAFLTHAAGVDRVRADGDGGGCPSSPEPVLIRLPVKPKK
jgi:hypothetical protein